MLCPLCQRENEANNRFCIHCGEPLPTAADTPNQVWNTNIEQAQNQKNSRTALVVLCTSLALLLVLMGVLLCNLPTMDFGDEFRFSFFDSLPTFGTPVPEAYAAISDGADRDFVKLFEEYMEKDYDDDYADSRRLSERYYEDFNRLKDEHFTDGNLAVCAARTAQALDKLRKGSDLTEPLQDASTTHNILWLEGYMELFALVEELHTDYGILYKNPEIAEFYMWLLPIYKAELEVERDLTAQLMGVLPTTDDTFPVPYLQYTNHTPYALDIVIYNDYETEDDFFTEEHGFDSLQPGETEIIPLWGFPDDYENWYINWAINEMYYNGVDIYEYYW